MAGRLARSSSWLPIFGVVGILLSSATIEHAVAAERPVREILVTDSRPLHAAVRQIEELCHCSITYEDPAWRRYEVIDKSSHAKTRPRLPLLAPAWRPFQFSVDDSRLDTPEHVLNSVRSVVDMYHISGNVGLYDVTVSGALISVVPAAGSIFDTVVSLDRTDRPAMESIVELVQAVSVSRGRKIKLGVMPVGKLSRTSLAIEADHESAADILGGIVAGLSPKLSWSLLYDYGLEEYALNLHEIQ